METYGDFAAVYDTFMEETPYEEWAEYVSGIIEKYGISRPVKSGREQDLVVDLGCGTGTFTEKLAHMGYDMIGIDLSGEMLAVAMEKREMAETGTLYLHQDMRQLDLYSTVGAVLSVCDSVNYLLEEQEVLETFRRVNNFLYPGGIFLFDFNTVYKYEQVIGDTTIAENRDDCSFIWENYYDPREQINEYDLTVFVQEGEDPCCFRRFQENHYQRGYLPEQMKSLVEQAGLRVEFMQDADTHGEVRPESERIYILAREVEKNGK